jgi:DNA-binding NarL/FixJ family response regulator
MVAEGAGMIRVVLVDDDRLVRGGLRVLVDEEPDLWVVGEAADGAEALTVCARSDPDVVLMDVRMAGMDGIEATRRLVAGGPRPRVLVVTTFGREEYVFAALSAGASGFVGKTVDPVQLMHAVRVVASGEALVLPVETRRLIETHGRLSPGGPLRRALDTLTAREGQVLRLVAGGYSNAEIAAQLVVGAETVKTHVASVLAKIGVRDRTQAVIAAYESGFVQPQGVLPRAGETNHSRG